MLIFEVNTRTNSPFPSCSFRGSAPPNSWTHIAKAKPKSIGWNAVSAHLAHGDYLGDFGLLLTAVMPFRSITRVPFIWADPTQETALTTDAMASTIDLSVSILDRVGLKPYRGMQGQSFLQSLDGKSPHRSVLFIEYNDGPARLGFDTPARMRALRDEDWRITLYGGQDWGELYDLRNDPNETRNLWDSEEHQDIRAELLLRLNHHLIAQMDESPIAERMA